MHAYVDVEVYSITHKSIIFSIFWPFPWGKFRAPARHLLSILDSWGWKSSLWFGLVWFGSWFGSPLFGKTRDSQPWHSLLHLLLDFTLLTYKAHSSHSSHSLDTLLILLVLTFFCCCCCCYAMERTSFARAARFRVGTRAERSTPRKLGGSSAKAPRKLSSSTAMQHAAGSRSGYFLNFAYTLE